MTIARNNRPLNGGVQTMTGTPKRQNAAWIKKHGFTNGTWRLEEQARLRAELKKRFQEIKDLEQQLMQLNK